MAHGPKAESLLEDALSRLTRREEKVIRLRFGHGDGFPRTQAEVAAIFNVSTSTISRIESRALRTIQLIYGRERLEALIPKLRVSEHSKARLLAAVETVRALTPELILHLRAHHDDLNKIPWDVFEHLVGEFLAQRGFQDVRLVGRDPHTAADLYAAKLVDPIGSPFRLFVEVKRTRRRAGIEVINEVFGAMLAERSSFGWHAAIIVSVAGYRELRRESRTSLALKGVDLKDKSDLLRWLADYKPNKRGLWLPSPKKVIVTASTGDRSEDARQRF